MQGKYILLALIVIIFVMPMCGASLNKISDGAPVFVGETNVDISSALNQCRIIAWWPEGSDRTTPPAKNITLRPLNEVEGKTFHYNFSPEEYTRYTGKWYCEDTKPYRFVFEVFEPQVSLRVWDTDGDKDVSGTSVPGSANITYRIDTNLDKALSSRYRPDMTPADSFYTVRLTDPYGSSITNIYTGNIGGKDTQILLFDSTPFIAASPYYWKHGSAWNRASRGTNGELVYPSGTYHFIVRQNLNSMLDSYTAGGIKDTDGILTSGADVTFIPAPVLTTPPVTQTLAESTTSPYSPTPVVTVPSTTVMTTTPVPVKTTYQPLPEYIALAGLGIALVLIARQRG